jgi:hypothetical protein
MGLRELLAAEVLAFLHGDMRAPAITDRVRLERAATFGRLLYNADEYGLIQPYGIPQAFNTTHFPAPILDTLADIATSGANTYYGWVVPVYRSMDPVYGVTDEEWTLENWGNLTRGLHYVYGTPSDSVQDDDAGASPGFQFNWTAPTIGTKQPTPDGYVCVVGTVDDITDSGSKVCALADRDAATATATTLGTVEFGAAPALADLVKVQRGTISADQRVWTTLTEGTDYTWGTYNETLKLIDDGTAASGEPIRLNYWFRKPPAVVVNHGGSTDSNVYVHLRLVNWQATGNDPDLRLPRGIVIDCPRVNIAGLAGQLLTSNPDGFHRALDARMVAEYSAAHGYSLRKEIVHWDNRNIVDYFSNDITAAAA